MDHLKADSPKGNPDESVPVREIYKTFFHTDFQKIDVPGR